MPREEARRAGKKVGEAVARRRKACGKPRSIKAAGVAETEDEADHVHDSGSHHGDGWAFANEIILALLLPWRSPRRKLDHGHRGRDDGIGPGSRTDRAAVAGADLR